MMLAWPRSRSSGVVVCVPHEDVRSTQRGLYVPQHVDLSMQARVGLGVLRTAETQMRRLVLIALLW